MNHKKTSHKGSSKMSHDELRKKISTKTLMDDGFMSAFFNDFPEGVELVLQIILERKDLEILKVETQMTMSNLYGRDIRIDVFAKDDKGVFYNIEIQNASKGSGFKRARYHSSMLDSNNPGVIGEDFENLPKTIVIFICDGDIIGANKPLYRINRVIRETGEVFEDGADIVYVNGKIKDADTRLGRLMQDFFNPDPDTMNYDVLAKRSRILKTDEEAFDMVREFLTEEEWNAAVSQGTDIGLTKGLEQGLEQGIQAFVLDNLEEKVPEERIIDKLKRRFSLTEDEAQRKYLIYAK